MQTDTRPSSRVRQQEAGTDNGRTRARGPLVKILPVLAAGVVSGVARAVTAWLLDHGC